MVMHHTKFTRFGYICRMQSDINTDMTDQKQFRNPLRHIAVIPGTPFGDLAGLEALRPDETETNWRKRGFLVKPKTVFLGRNEPCHCGSKKKYKNCHLQKDEDARFILKDNG